MIGQLQSPLVLAKIEPTSPNVAFGSIALKKGSRFLANSDSVCWLH